MCRLCCTSSPIREVRLLCMLFPHLTELDLDQVEDLGGGVKIVARTGPRPVACRACGTLSARCMTGTVAAAGPVVRGTAGAGRTGDPSAHLRQSGVRDGNVRRAGGFAAQVDGADRQAPAPHGGTAGPAGTGRARAGRFRHAELWVVGVGVAEQGRTPGDLGVLADGQDDLGEPEMVSRPRCPIHSGPSWSYEPYGHPRRLVVGAGCGADVRSVVLRDLGVGFRITLGA